MVGDALLEGKLIDTTPANIVREIQKTLHRYRRWILVAAGLLLAGGAGYLYWSQEKAKQYREAFQKGMALWNKGEAERAATQLRKAAQIDPRDPDLWVMIGRSELVSGHLDRAPDAWEEALRREPGYKPALFERAKEALVRHITRRIPPPRDGKSGWLPLGLEAAARVEGGEAEAQRILSDLRDASGDSPAFAKFARGAIHLVDGHYREAQPGFQGYAELTGWDATGFALAGIAGHYGGLSERADRSLSEALTRRPEKEWIRVRAEARYLAGNSAGAREDYREAGLEKEAEPLFAHRLPAQGLILWLRADAGVDVTGSTVTRWQDQSDGKHDAAPRDPAQGPQLSPSAFRGRPAILFSGKDDELRLPDGFEDFSAGLSLFVVGEPMMDSAEEWSFILLGTPARGSARLEVTIGRRRETPNVVYAAEDLKTQPRPYVPGVPPTKDFEGFSAIHEPSGEARLYKRGVPVETATLILPRKVLRVRNRLGSGFKGRLAEVVLYNRSLSELERLGVEAYLQERYFPPAPPSTEKH
jgi:tetratricopeptide (TPR) repeat protein